MKNLNEKLNELNRVIGKFDFRKSSVKCNVPNCPHNAINSHTIQKGKILSFLEDRTELNYIKIYSLDNIPQVDFKEQKLSSFHLNKRKLSELGKSEASTIFGFCSEHDKVIFKSIEDEKYSKSDFKNFLHSYRAYIYHVVCMKGSYLSFIDLINKNINIKKTIENFTQKYPLKNELIDIIPDDYIFTEQDLSLIREDQRSMIFKSLNLNDFGLSNIDFTKITGKQFKELNKKSLNSIEDSLVLEELNFENYLANINIQLQAMDSFSHTLYDKLIKMEFNFLNYFVHKFEGIYPIAGSFAVNIDYLNVLNLANNFNPIYSVVIFPDLESKETYIIFSSVDIDSSKLFFSKINILSDLEMKLFITNIIVFKGANCFISPRLWNKLSNSEKDLLLSDKKELPPFFVDIENKGINLFDNKFKE